MCLFANLNDFLFIVNDELISSIGRGLLLLVGISRTDTKDDLDYMWVIHPPLLIFKLHFFNSNYFIPGLGKF